MRESHSPPLKRHLTFVLAILVGIAIPLRASGVVAEQAALGIALIAALALLVSSPEIRNRLKVAIASTAGKGAIAIFAAWSITAVCSHDVLGSFKIGGRTALFLLAAVIIWAAVFERPQAHRIVWKSLIAVAFALTSLVLLALFHVPYVGDVLGAQLQHHIHPIHQFKAFAAVSVCLIPVGIWVGRRLGGAWRWLGYAYAPMAFVIVILTYNRSALAGFLAMALAGMVLLILTRHRHTKAMIVTIIAGSAGLIAWVASKEEVQLQYIPNPNAVETYLPSWLLDPHRQNIWKFAWEHFLNHPWVGNGIDQLNKLPGASKPVPGLQQFAALVPSHPHNWALEILAETGLIGFMPTIAVLALVAIGIARRYIRSEDDTDLALFTLMAGFWGSALFNFSIWAVWWQLTFFILFAIVSATRPQKAS